MADKWWNLHQRQVGWDDNAKDVVCRAMCSMDRNVFSTTWLRDRYHKEYKARLGKRNLPELFVCRNHVPRKDWPVRDEGDGKLRVGFMGSGSHVWDVQKIYAAIHAAHEYTDAETVMIGYNPAAPDREPDELTINDVTYQMRSEKSKRFRDGWAKVVDRHIPWIDPGDYRRAALPLDIGLAPLARADDFTMGKSDAKALEYTISGAACILSNNGIYNTAGWKHEVNCLMANSVQEMAEATLRLIADPKLRFELVTAAQEMVWNERNEDVLCDEWSDALCP
jgi:glycosyltransferase involved in cell wall biosynthesis